MAHGLEDKYKTHDITKEPLLIKGKDGALFIIECLKDYSKHISIETAHGQRICAHPVSTDKLIIENYKLGGYS